MGQSHSGSAVSTCRADITRLQVDCIVNAANETGLGCDIPGHCVDSAIHAAAGPGLRHECEGLGGLPVATPKLTGGHRLPCTWVIHVTGPRVDAATPDEDHRVLASCYERSLQLAATVDGLRSVAFCCISTGIFGYDKARAARTAVATVRGWQELRREQALPTLEVLFATYTDADEDIYSGLVGETSAPVPRMGFAWPVLRWPSY